MSLKSVIFVLFVLPCLAGCGSGNSSGSGSAQITIAFASPPPATIMIGGTANMSVKVTNDLASGGVLWSCAPVASCGSFSPNPTSSVYATAYTAPLTIPSGGQVTITAASVTDSTATLTASVNVLPLPVSIAFTGNGLPSVIQPSAVVAIGAVVSNDNNNLGVNWTCLPVGLCGTFSQSPAPSGTLISYTAPSSTPASGQITITATSVADPTQFVSVTGAMSGVASTVSLNGQYAFSLTAAYGSRGASSLLGSVALDGNGNVTGGIEDLVSPTGSDLDDAILPVCGNPATSSSLYQVDSSGHGRMRTCTANGQTTTFSFVLTSNSHALIIEADGSPASGTLDLQTPAAAGFAASELTGGYSFTMTGTLAGDATSELASGGVFTADGVSALSSGQLDLNTNGVFTSAAGLSGTFAAPDSNGRGTLSLPSLGKTFIYYIVSPKALRLAEADGLACMGGSGFAQGVPLAPLSGQFVYQHSGWSAGGRTLAVGQFAVEGSEFFKSGVSDAILGAAAITFNPSVTVKGSYRIRGNQLGSLQLTDAAGGSDFNFYAVDPGVNILDPNNSSATSSGGMLLLHSDPNINGTGVLIPQTNSIFLGYQVLNLTNAVTTATPGFELDLVGVALSDGAQNLNFGLADYDQDSGNPDPVLGTQLAGQFQIDSKNPGRFTGNITVPALGLVTDYPFIPPGGTTFNVAYYQVNNTQALVVEADTLGLVSGFMQQQILP